MDLIIGTAGHIDHGKTALVQALTGINTDRLPEERERGITVDLGFAELAIGELHLGFVDVPGHERFVKNMLAGASGIDVALMVIAADEGVMPQTREHFDILRLLGIRRGLIALTKSDLADAETIELAQLEIAELVDGSFLDGAPVIAVSSRTGAGVEDLRAAIAKVGLAVEPRSERLVPRLWIDRRFAAKGFGTVVTGTLASGSIKNGDELELLPQGRRVRVRGLQTHGREVAAAKQGQRVAVNLAGVDHSEVARGMLLASAGTLAVTQIIDAQAEILPSSPRPLRSRQRVRVHIGTAEVLARIQVLNDAGEAAPGASDLIQLRLESPVATVPGERFIIRSYSPSMTIAGGEVLDPLAGKHKRKDLAAAREFLDAFRSDPSTTGRIALIVDRAGPNGLARSVLASCTGYEAPLLNDVIARLTAVGRIVQAGDRIVSSSVLVELAEAAMARIDVFHTREPLEKGISRRALHDALGARLPEDVFSAVLDRLTAAGRAVTDNDLVRSALYRVELSPEESAIIDKLKGLIGASLLEPPKISEVVESAAAGTRAGSEGVQKLLRRLVDHGDIVKVSDEYYFAAEAIEELKAKVKQFAHSRSDRSIDVPAFKDLAGVSRKFAIPLIEYFDRERVTMRRGDKRVVL